MSLEYQIDYTFKQTGLEAFAETELFDLSKKLLQLTGNDITTMPDITLSENIYNAARYMSFLQLYYNQANATYIHLKREHDLEVLKEVQKLKLNKTIKEKTAYVIENIPGLYSQFEELQKLEITVNLLQKMPESVMELANALKKELQRRNIQLGKNIS